MYFACIFIISIAYCFYSYDSKNSLEVDVKHNNKFIKSVIKEYKLKGDDKLVFSLIYKRFLRQCRDSDLAEIESIIELNKYIESRKNAHKN